MKSKRTEIDLPGLTEWVEARRAEVREFQASPEYAAMSQADRDLYIEPVLDQIDLFESTVQIQAQRLGRDISRFRAVVTHIRRERLEK